MGKAKRLRAQRAQLVVDLEAEYAAHLDARMEGRIVCDACGFEQAWQPHVDCLYCGHDTGVMLDSIWTGDVP